MVTTREELFMLVPPRSGNIFVYQFLTLISPDTHFGDIPYFSAYKTEFFPLPKQFKNLDPSCKTDLDL